MGRFRVLKEVLSGVPTPTTNYVNFFWDGSDGQPKFKDENGNVSVICGSTEKNKLASLVYDVVRDYGAKDDLVTVFDGAMTSGSGVLTCATSTPFLVTDIGKRITVTGAGASGAMLVSTIQSFTSTSIVVLANAAGTTVASKGTSFGTDNTTAIQNAITAAGTAGGGIVWFPITNKGRYGITSTLTVSKPGIQLWGPASSFSTDIGDYTRSGGAWICWWAGTAPTSFTNGIMVAVAPVQGASNPALTGFGIQGLSLDCRNGDQNGALIGLQILSGHAFFLRDWLIVDPSAVGIDTGVVTTLGEARDCTRWLIERGCVRALDNPAGAVTAPITTSTAVVLSAVGQSLTVTANTLPTAGFIWLATNLGYPVLANYTGGGGTTTLTGCSIAASEVVNAPSTVNGSNIVQAVPGNACALRFDGDATANTCCSVLLMVQLSHGTTWGPAAIESRNSDSVIYDNVMINGGVATNDGAINRIRKPGIRLCGSNTSATLASRNDEFRGGSAGAGGVSVLGVNNAGTRLTAMSQPHYWPNYQMGNGEPLPVIEGGAFFSWYPNGGFAALGHPAAPSVADQAIAAATLTLITGSLTAMPPQGFQVGGAFRWTIKGAGGAAGTAANTFVVRIGTTGTSADAAVATFTTAVGTAAASTFSVDIAFTIRTLGAAATAAALCTILNSTAAGFVNTFVSVIPGTMATFNTTTAQQFMSVSLLTGAAKTATITQCLGECISPANP